MRFITRLPGLVRYPPNTQPWEPALRAPDLRRMAAATEAAGFDALSIPEQIVLHVDDAATMGGRWPDALTTVAFFAGVTERLHFMTSVLILPLHPVVQLAKAVATLDLLTDGRFELGVGVSIFPREYEALGVPFHERGAIADEYLEAMSELWTSERPCYSGSYVQFEDVVFDPKPGAGRPTIWVGGDSDAALRRAARFGGWIPWQTPLEALPDRLGALSAAIGEARPGTTPRVCVPLALLRVDSAHRPLEGSGHPELSSDPDEVLARLAFLALAGVTDVTVPSPRVGSLSEYLEWLERFAADVMEPARAGETGDG